ncbi:MAG TPA: zinc-ribbon domain containing protein [Acidobacteriaceae bacterium]|nr:zinc-ribbon domain containing protein [Acidobacteriaceae bacterium]
MEFTDRVLKCSDCGSDFIFTAGEQLFFFDRQFKNDPKRCKLCKAKRAGLGRSADGAAAAAALPLSRTETRTECSACGIETTVPFKPTQGRPVFCRSCFQLKRVPAAVAKVASLDTPALAIEQAMAEANAERPMTLSAVGAIADTPAAALNPEPVSQAIELLAAEAAQA